MNTKPRRIVTASTLVFSFVVIGFAVALLVSNYHSWGYRTSTVTVDFSSGIHFDSKTEYSATFQERWRWLPGESSRTETISRDEMREIVRASSWRAGTTNFYGAGDISGSFQTFTRCPSGDPDALDPAEMLAKFPAE